MIVDFTGLAPGTELYLINEGPDEPFGGGEPGDRLRAGRPRHDRPGHEVRGRCRSPRADTSVPPGQLHAAPFTPLGPATQHAAGCRSTRTTRHVLPGVRRPWRMLGTVERDGNPVPLHWDDPITENPALGATEIWEIHNFTEDAHPIHIHQVQFQVVDRQPFDGDGPAAGALGDAASRTP